MYEVECIRDSLFELLMCVVGKKTTHLQTVRKLIDDNHYA